MKLSIADMRAVLKERSQSMVGRKASDSAADILAGVNDIRAILNEMETYAVELATTEDQLRAELEEKDGKDVG